MELVRQDYQAAAVEVFSALLAKESSSDRVRSAVDGFDLDAWAALAGLGGTTLSLAEEFGGAGRLLDATLIGLECGRRLTPFAYAESVTALRVIAEGGCLAEHPDLLAAPLALVDDPAGSLEGEAVWAAGRHVRAGRQAPAAVVVLPTHAAIVDLVDSDGRDPVGVRRTSADNVGGLPLATVAMRAATVRCAWSIDDRAAERMRGTLGVLRSAELVGAGREALDHCRDHVLSRTQFGKPIGANQAVQHRLADRLTALDAAELLVLRAASYDADPAALAHYVSTAVPVACEAAELACQEALQFFGGYGFTLEYDAHLYLRFAKAMSVLAQHSGHRHPADRAGVAPAGWAGVGERD